MKAHGATVAAPIPAAARTGVGLAGAGFVGLGLWARREAGRALARERIVHGGEPPQPVRNAAQARSLAEFIRQNTLDATGGRTYADVPAYLDGEGKPTTDAGAAARDERTGQPLENPEHALWIQSTALQTALLQAYVAFRLAELTIALGASFLLVRVALGAAARPQA